MKKTLFGSRGWLLSLALMLLGLLPASAQNMPLMGWSSWNTYGFNINDSVIKVQADAMVNLGFLEKGYNHINIDDGFFGGRYDDGKLKIHPTRFPNGLRPLVDYIHSKGLKAGIYSDAGANTCASYWGTPKDTIGIGVGLYKHDAQDMALYFNELDFDFIKVDYCGADARNKADKLDLNVEQRYKEIYEALKNTGRTDITWNICRWAFPGTWACEIADSWRTTEDIYLGWESVKSIINQSLYLSAYTSYGHYNDMDMLEVGRGLTEEEDKTHFGMWCIMSSPLLIGCDLNDIKGNALALMQNDELIALNQNKLGLQAYVVKKQGGYYVLVKDVETLQGKKRAVAFYNPSNAKVEANVDFVQLDLAGSVKVRDLFEREDLGVFRDELVAQVPAHGTRIYLLEADKRLERTLYEAETAWLSRYQEIKDNDKELTAIYSSDAACSGGTKVGWLGNTAENDLQWRNVFSNEGGEYTMSIAFITGENRTFKISVNGGEAIETTVNSGGWNTVGTKSYKITLNKGNNTIRLYTDSGWMPDIDCMTLEAENVPEVPEENNYPINFNKNQNYTHASRRLNSVSLNSQTISLPTPLKVYSLVDTPTFSAKAGETVTAKFGFSSDWMHGFVYLDCGQDGSFEATLGENASIPEGSDIMAFSYAEQQLGSGEGYNSAGDRVNNSNVLNPPSFVIPENLKDGFYRMRYKVDWASIDPAGRPEDGNGILKNGGAICDVRLNVHSDKCGIEAKCNNGTVTTADGKALTGYSHNFGTALAIKIVPNEGYVCNAITIRHGHNLDGDSLIHGVAQYSDVIIPGFLIKNNEYEIPAEYIDGDVRIVVDLARSSGSSDGIYSLSFDKDAKGLSDYTGKINITSGTRKRNVSVSGDNIYFDKTAAHVTVPNSMKFNVNVEDNREDLDYYLYIDLNNDGVFTPMITDAGVPAQSSELVSFTHYNGKNSAGETVEAKGKTLPAFELPSIIADGVYRVRLKLDTNDINPDGGADITKNNGVVVDMLLNIVRGNKSLRLFTTNGNIYGTNNSAMPTSVPAYTKINIAGTPVANGYVANRVLVKHGHNLSGPQYVNGNIQWSEYSPASHRFSIPADSVNGDVEVYIDFVASDAAEYRLVFSDEFNAEDGTQPTNSKWMRCQRQGATWNRWLSDSKEVIYQQGGDLVARAIPNPDRSTDNVPMITGGIKSHRLFGFTYGYIEARIFSNPWVGNFPAFWMMPENQSAGWPDCGEIDIWETIDTQNRSWHTVHSNWTYDLGQKNNPKSSYDVAVDLSCYHTYGLEWNETSLVWFVDGKEVGRYEKSTDASQLAQGQWPFDKHFHIILNQSVGNGSWAANADVNHVYETRFDWVRVYQKAGMENTNGTVGIKEVGVSSKVDVGVVDGGIAVSAERSTNVSVADLSGRLVFDSVVDGNKNISLSTGFYIVNGTKVFVK